MVFDAPHAFPQSRLRIVPPAFERFAKSINLSAAERGNLPPLLFVFPSDRVYTMKQRSVSTAAFLVAGFSVEAGADLDSAVATEDAPIANATTTDTKSFLTGHLLLENVRYDTYLYVLSYTSFVIDSRLATR